MAIDKIDLTYPTEYSNEIPFYVIFSCAPYSVLATNRTRSFISGNSSLSIALPFTSEPKMSLEHKFAEGTNPVGPVLSLAGLKNTSGGYEALLERLAAPAAAFYEASFTTDTYRRFSNVTEATMTSEARRSFTFKYLFVPKSANEANEVDKIVNSFRNFSYPQKITDLPERTLPQNLWTISAVGNSISGSISNSDLTNSWLGDPLPCVLQSMSVDKGDPSDPVLKVLPNTKSLTTLMSITFIEFETGTYDPNDGVLKSKSEIAAGE
jgi:hypothetical protein